MIKQVKNNKTIGFDFFQRVYLYKIMYPYPVSFPQTKKNLLIILIHNSKDRELVTMQR